MSQARQSAHSRVADGIRLAIQAQRWQEGEFLPAERDLAREFHVSRPTVRAALETLAEGGIIHREEGCRPVVGHVRARPLEKSWLGIISTAKLSQIVSTRTDDRARTVLGALRVLEETDYNVAFLNPNELSGQWGMDLAQEHYAGILYVANGREGHRALEGILEETEIPLVVTDSATELDREDTNWVCLNDREGARLATAYLIENGHTDIVHVTFEENLAFLERRAQGYSTAMHDAGLQPRIMRVGAFLKEQWDLETDYAEEMKAFPKNATAITTSTDVMARMAHDWVLSTGRLVPDDISIVGFDNFDTSEELGLTTVAFMSETIGRRGAEVLLEAVKPSAANHIYHEQVTPKLVIRKSVRPRGEGH